VVGRPAIHNHTRLAQWLRLAGRTRSSFAREIGEDPKYISRLCSGNQQPGPVIARKIVAATKNAVTFEDLYAAPSSESAA